MMRRFYSKRVPTTAVAPKGPVKTRYVGTCPVCQKRHKLLKDVMVHHGYQRPGHGSIVGDCFAVGYKPYEVSTNGCEEYKAYAKGIEVSLIEALANLESGNIRTLHVLRSKPGTFGREMETVTLSADSENAKERADFDRELQSQITRTKSDIKGWQFEQERMTRLINEWVEKPVITFEEHVELVKAERLAATAERRAELEAKRQAKREKAEALKVKRVAWEAEKVALIAKYKGLFEKLATGVESLADRKQCALSHWIDMHKARSKKGYLHFYSNELECDAALIVLGLAAEKEVTWNPSKKGEKYIQHADQWGSIR